MAHRSKHRTVLSRSISLEKNVNIKIWNQNSKFFRKFFHNLFNSSFNKKPSLGLRHGILNTSHRVRRLHLFIVSKILIKTTFSLHFNRSFSINSDKLYKLQRKQLFY